MPEDSPRGEGSVETTKIPAITEHLFRQEAGKLVSALTGIFGIHRLQLAEDVVQEALVRALRTWPYYGVPDNPAAWLMRTAKNRAFDLLRREQLFHEKQDEIAASLERLPEEGARFDDEIRDDRLRLIFACCHPSISLEDQTVLALRTLCGFGVLEIASAFLSGEAAVAKRLVRAKQRIQDQGLAFEIPSGPDLPGRLDGVLRVIYLLFNEGYKSSTGEQLVRADLCDEAIRLCSLLAEHPVTVHPRVHALLALMLLHASRLPARTDEEGGVLTLDSQDRSKWDGAMIARGLHHLAQAATGGPSDYHFQAGIAAIHATARGDGETDWPRILAHYDAWMASGASPVVALNRAVAVAKVHGPQAGLDALDSIAHQEALKGYYLFHAVLGDFEERLGRWEQAAFRYETAYGHAPGPAERNFLSRRFRRCRERVDGSIVGESAGTRER